MKVAIVAVLSFLLIIGWISFLADSAKNASAGDVPTLIAQAEEWQNEGLYQRAANQYEEIIKIKDTEEIRKSLIQAYKSRYQEDRNEMSGYVKALQSAVAVYPKNVEFAQALLEVYIQQDNYIDAYNLISSAELSGITDASVVGRKNEIRYSYKTESSVYDAFVHNGDLYNVKIGELWGRVSNIGDKISDNKYKFLSVAENDIMILNNGSDSRLLTEELFTMGIFDFDVTDAGAYSEGLVAVKNNGKYSYYDEFAKKQFGDYDCASKFQGEKAAIQKNGQWYFIDKNGEDISEPYADISVNPQGAFLNNSIILASKNAGTYIIYDENLKETGEIAADSIDSCYDGYIAFKKGDKWGFADTTGNVVIEPKFSDAKSFSNGLAAVCENGKWGFIDESGSVVIDCQYDQADYFNSDGSCMVKMPADGEQEGRWQLIVLKIGIVG